MGNQGPQHSGQKPEWGWGEILAPWPLGSLDLGFKYTLLFWLGSPAAEGQVPLPLSSFLSGTVLLSILPAAQSAQSGGTQLAQKYFNVSGSVSSEQSAEVP